MAKNIALGNFRPLQNGLEKIFGGLEASIMECVWKVGKANVRHVHDYLNESREIAYTTVMTVMGRLACKGYLQKEKCGNAFVYSPSYSREDLEMNVINSVLTGLTDHLTAGALSHFVDAISESDKNALDELEKLIAIKRQELEGAKIE